MLVEDLAFNSLLVVANRMLTELADDAAIELEPELTEAFRATPVALEELWDDEHGRYCSRDVTTGDLMPEPTVAAFVTLWAGLRRDRMRAVVDDLGADGLVAPLPGAERRGRPRPSSSPTATGRARRG